MKNMYLIYLSQGDVSDVYFKNLFIVSDENQAIQYCAKGNILFSKWRQYYSALSDDIDAQEERHERCDDWLHCYNRSLSLGIFGYEKITIR